MRFLSGRALRDQPAHAVTFFGMSGVGKTSLAGLLQKRDWFQYSVDYRIGTRYMDEHIVDNFKREAMRNPFLRQLLRSDSIKFTQLFMAISGLSSSAILMIFAHAASTEC